MPTELRGGLNTIRDKLTDRQGDAAGAGLKYWRVDELQVCPNALLSS